jgi:hypothetical protein
MLFHHANKSFILLEPDAKRFFLCSYFKFIVTVLLQNFDAATARQNAKPGNSY